MKKKRKKPTPKCETCAFARMLVSTATVFVIAGMGDDWDGVAQNKAKAWLRAQGKFFGKKGVGLDNG